MSSKRRNRKPEDLFIDRTTLSDEIVCIFHDTYRCSDEDLLCDPREARRFCRQVRDSYRERLQRSSSGPYRLRVMINQEACPLSDRLILKTLINSRKRGRAPKRK
ncbi:MAG TPA: hypothetical protein VLH09_10335 [Bryobacteraceae bacterium]|nr:hypothetical protein [Bryobacteraceae bacterium]